MSSFQIRSETSADRARVATLLAQTYQTQGVQAIEMATAIRQMENRNENLSLVMEQKKTVVASAHFVPVTVAGQAGAVMLAQLALDVTQDALDVKGFLSQAMAHVKSQNFQALLLQGDPEEFAEEGFVVAEDQGIKGPDQQGAKLLVKVLQGDKLGLSGVVEVPDFMR